ncbi:poly(R)-hydroxyalkanoic acid synthase subunit PhaE [Marinobacterium sp. MBR-109]|uniref:poly(R)-hydroxyalkanoic acid synthase subunit PhaE n=1 Tax=Marinobacterium sp. MBR-109 TaxID=3156462 RepID=UPI0033971E09
MTEQLLNIMRQWIEQLEQHNSTDEQAGWEHMQQLLTAGISQQIPQEHTELLLKLTRQSASFNRFAAALLQHAQQDSVDSAVLLDQFKQHLDQLTSDWVLHSWQLPEQLGILMGLFSVQQPPWQDSLNQFAQLLATLLSNLQPVARPDLVTQLKECLCLLERFEHARTGYMAQLSTINALALERMTRQLESDAVTDIDQLHQLWIESYESIYQQHIGSHDYCVALGEISNAAMALRHGWQQQRDRFCSALGLVTDTRHDELAQRHHQLRRRVRGLERELAELRHSLQPKASDKDPNAQDQS